jgi:hypothetical protein
MSYPLHPPLDREPTPARRPILYRYPLVSLALAGVLLATLLGLLAVLGGAR